MEFFLAGRKCHSRSLEKERGMTSTRCREIKNGTFGVLEIGGWNTFKVGQGRRNHRRYPHFNVERRNKPGIGSKRVWEGGEG